MITIFESEKERRYGRRQLLARLQIIRWEKEELREDIEWRVCFCGPPLR